MSAREFVTIEYFHRSEDRYVTLRVPKDQILTEGPFITAGIERAGARIIHDEDKESRT